MMNDDESVMGNVSIAGEDTGGQITVYYHPLKNPHLGVMYTSVQPERDGKVNVNELEELFGGLRNLKLVAPDGSTLGDLVKDDKTGVSKEAVVQPRRTSIHITGEQVRGGETAITKATVNNISINVDADYFAPSLDGGGAADPDAWRKSLRVFPALTPSADHTGAADGVGGTKCKGCGEFYGHPGMNYMCSMCCDFSTEIGKLVIERRAKAGFDKGSGLMSREKANKFLAGLAVSVPEFKNLRKIVTAQATWTPSLLAEALREFKNFITSEQAKILRDVLQDKFTNELDYKFHHVLCSRVLDYWNLGVYGGVGECYYGSDEHSHATYKIEKNKGDLTRLMRRMKSMAHSFKETTLYDDDFVEFVSRFLELDSGH